MAERGASVSADMAEQRTAAAVEEDVLMGDDGETAQQASTTTPTAGATQNLAASDAVPAGAGA